MNTPRPRSTLARLAAASLLAFAAAATAQQAAQGSKYLELDPARFEHSTRIDNEWWPLKPGTRLIYEGYTAEDGKKVRHRLEDTVTDLVKVINGVRTLVSLEIDYSDGKMIEKEIVFHAQDKEGNVWHFGQLRETYDEDELVGSRGWVVDRPKGAKAGIRMTAKPALGSPDYSQGYAPAPYNWTDRAKVSKMGTSTKVRAGAYKDVMVIDEWDGESRQGAVQTKHYARGIGVVRVGYRGPDKNREEMELVKIEQLGPEAMAKARAEALAIEQRAYDYPSTPQVEAAPDGSRK